MGVISRVCYRVHRVAHGCERVQSWLCVTLAMASAGARLDPGWELRWASIRALRMRGS